MRAPLTALRNAPANHASAPAMPLPSISGAAHNENANLPPLKSIVDGLPQSAVSPVPAIVRKPQTAAPHPVTTFSAINTTNKKRKSTDALEGDDEHIVSFDDMPNNVSCDTIRRKINAFLETKEMNKTRFCKELGVNSKSFASFMGQSGPYGGSNNSTFDSAWVFFQQREVDARGAKKQKIADVKAQKAAAKVAEKAAKTNGGVASAPAAPTQSTPAAVSAPEAAKKGKTVKNVKSAPGSNSAGVDISDIKVDGEETDTVPIFDTCDEIRRKIRAHLEKPGVTQAQFCRDVHAQFQGPKKPANIQGTQLARFRSMSGPYSGNSSLVFYGAYVFFEKVRIKTGVAKTKAREENEKKFAADGGIDRDRGP